MSDSEIGGSDFALLFGTYVLLHVIRFLCIVIFWPILKLIGYGMSF